MWVGEAVELLLDHLDSYGVCVMDHFLGAQRGSGLISEIHKLEAAEPFRVSTVIPQPVFRIRVRMDPLWSGLPGSGSVKIRNNYLISTRILIPKCIQCFCSYVGVFQNFQLCKSTGITVRLHNV